MPPHHPRHVPHMAVCREGDALPGRLLGNVLAVGNFDGVHLGHQALIATAGDRAARDGAPSAVLTFEPHPRAFFDPATPHFRLTPEPAKLKIFEKLGLDAAFIRRFDGRLAATSAEDFVRDLLKRELGAKAVVIGHDFHFGRGRAGTPAVLASLGEQLSLDVCMVAPLQKDGSPVSSSRIRGALSAGNVALANSLLGYRWFVTGQVIHGEKRGRTLGFPTANLRLEEGCGLAHGIYAVRLAAESGETRSGVASFGRRPTFDNGAPLLETHLFDYSGDLYGCLVEVEFVGWIRPEERFGSAEELVSRMREDEKAARAALAKAAGGDERSFIG